MPALPDFLRLNFEARKHPRNVLRRDQLHAENVAEYKPDTLHLRRACRWLANIDERLEHVKDGTPEHQRLISMWTELTATLEASRSSREAQTSADVAGLTEDELIERTTAILRQLLETRDAQRKGRAHIAAAVAEHAGLPSEAAADPAGEAAKPTPAPAPEPVCQYCHRTCVGREHFAYDVLHYDDPTEVAKRDAEATAVMMRQIGKPLPDWYRR